MPRGGVKDNQYPISASQAKRFKACPKQYAYRYVWPHGSFKQGLGYAEFGRTVHEAIENVLEEDPYNRTEDDLYGKFLWETKQLDYEYPDDWDKNLHTCLQNAAKFVSKLEEEIKGVEVEHTFRLSRPDIVYPLFAIMDICTDKGIIDWKTGKPRPEDEKIQAAVYLAAYAHKYNKLPEYIAFVYLKTGEKTVHSRTDDEGNVFWGADTEPEAWSQLVSLAKQILNAWETDVWPARPSPDVCHWCDYQLFCPQSGVGCEDVPWENY